MSQLTESGQLDTMIVAAYKSAGHAI